MAETMAQTMLQVQGMTCTGCERRIGTALRRVDGVREVTADHTTAEVWVRFDPRSTGRQAIGERITLAGYTVRDGDPGDPAGAGGPR